LYVSARRAIIAVVEKFLIYFKFSLNIDENECLQNKCHVNATCENKDGTHRCFCKGGFTGNGQSCNGNRTDQERTERNGTK
jgi:hypothetical protein